MDTTSSTLMPESVVIGVDGSEGGYHAMAWAVGEAARRKAVLTVLHAYQLPVALGETGYAVGPQRQRAEAEGLAARSRARLDRMAGAGAFAGRPVDVRYAVVRGEASAALVQRARRGALVVVGRRGVGTFDRVLMGSVSSSVVAVAPGTVVVVPRAARAREPRRVVVAVDPRDPSERALEVGFAAAERSGSALLAAYGVDEGMFVGATAGDLTWLERLRAEARADLETMAGRWAEKYPGVAWSVETGGKHAPGALLSVLRTDDLVVTGGDGRARKVGRVRGSLPDRTVRHATCAVMVVHH